MPDKDMPNPASNMEKAEGDRWSSDPDTVEVADRYKEGSGKTDEKTGGISNRELPQEIERQGELPERGTASGEHRAERENDR
jgi:hypothetical protein